MGPVSTEPALVEGSLHAPCLWAATIPMSNVGDRCAVDSARRTPVRYLPYFFIQPPLASLDESLGRDSSLPLFLIISVLWPQGQE